MTIDRRWIHACLALLMIAGAQVQSASARELPQPMLPPAADEGGDAPAGPSPENLPEQFNPLTGADVTRPQNLKNPPVLVSVSNFPGATRPQSGISFADHLYEFWIGVGMTRFLPVFYGEYPEVRPALVGDCIPRREMFSAAGAFVGNRVWFDEDEDGVQEGGERGVPGVCVSLLDAATGALLASTTSDSNGYYGFEKPQGRGVRVRFKLPPATRFSPPGEGSAVTDSDANPQSGESGVLEGADTDRSVDAGIAWDPGVAEVSSGEAPPGSVRIRRTIWSDLNRNGYPDEGEPGLEGVQVNLHDARTDELLSVTRSDAEGVFTFDIEAGRRYYLRVLPDLGAFFTRPDEEELAEDAINAFEDPIAGVSPVFDAATWDALQWNVGVKVAQAGPVRSGRIVFQAISRYYYGSRLFYASKHESVAIGGAGNVYGEDANDISSAFLDVERMLEASAAASGEPAVAAAGLHYDSNDFSETLPEGGQTGTTIDYFVNVLNASRWRYDPLSERYLRFDDHSDGRGTLYPSTDRMTGRQLAFSNVVVVFSEHKQIEGLKIEMGITPNLQNKAVLFRDGKAFPVIWSTLNEEYEKTTQRLRPPRILSEDGSRFPLKPGATWFIMVTTRTTIEDQGGGIWRVRFFEPPLVGDFRK